MRVTRARIPEPGNSTGCTPPPARAAHADVRCAAPGGPPHGPEFGGAMAPASRAELIGMNACAQAERLRGLGRTCNAMEKIIGSQTHAVFGQAILRHTRQAFLDHGVARISLRPRYSSGLSCAPRKCLCSWRRHRLRARGTVRMNLQLGIESRAVAGFASMVVVPPARTIRLVAAQRLAVRLPTPSRLSARWIVIAAALRRNLLVVTPSTRTLVIRLRDTARNGVVGVDKALQHDAPRPRRRFPSADRSRARSPSSYPPAEIRRRRYSSHRLR